MLRNSNHPTVQTFKRAIRPLIDAGRHGCIFAQFLWSFRCTSDGVARIRLLRDLMGDLPLIVEFRNSEWVSEKAFDFLRKHNLGFCCVDEPACKGLMHRISVVTSPIGYMRFHGRNASNWWKHNEAWERYDYRYTTEEMQEWIP